MQGTLSARDTRTLHSSAFWMSDCCLISCILQCQSITHFKLVGLVQPTQLLNCVERIFTGLPRGCKCKYSFKRNFLIDINVVLVGM